MSNQEIFMVPGHFLLEFILSILGVQDGDVSDNSMQVLSVILAGLFWWQSAAIVIAILKKQFGFYNGGQQ